MSDDLRMERQKIKVYLMSHVPHINEPCLTYESETSHLEMIHVAHMNESCHKYERVVSDIRMSHVINTDESCVYIYTHIHGYTYTHIYTHTHIHRCFTFGDKELSHEHWGAAESYISEQGPIYQVCIYE